MDYKKKKTTKKHQKFNYFVITLRSVTLLYELL